MPSGTLAALFHLRIRSNLVCALLRSRTRTLRVARVSVGAPRGFRLTVRERDRTSNTTWSYWLRELALSIEL